MTDTRHCTRGRGRNGRFAARRRNISFRGPAELESCPFRALISAFISGTPRNSRAREPHSPTRLSHAPHTFGSVWLGLTVLATRSRGVRGRRRESLPGPGGRRSCSVVSIFRPVFRDESDGA